MHILTRYQQIRADTDLIPTDTCTYMHIMIPTSTQSLARFKLPGPAAAVHVHVWYTCTCGTRARAEFGSSLAGHGIESLYLDHCIEADLCADHGTQPASLSLSTRLVTDSRSSPGLRPVTVTVTAVQVDGRACTAARAA